MFGIRKEIHTENVKSFHDAVKAIKAYIYLTEWEKAKSAIEDVKKKEADAFAMLEEKIKDNFQLLQKHRKSFEKNNKIISRLEREYEIKKLKYERRIEQERFKIRFKSIKDEIKKLYGMGKNSEALNLLNNFLEENKNKSEVVTYYAREKKKVLANIKKQQKKDKQQIKDNAELEAIRLAGLTLKNKEEEKLKKQEEKEKKKQQSFLFHLKEHLNFYRKLKAKYKKKKLIDEVKILLEEQSKAKEEIATKKLEHIHRWLIKELEKTNMLGFDIYGKILGSDKISGDSFGFSETKNKYNFYIGDATWHGVRAGLIVSVLSKTFQEQVGHEDIINLTLTVNNTLKESLQSKNFVTWIFFELDKNYKNAFNVSGMWHEPLIIYRDKTKTIERVIVGGLAGGIRLIKKTEDIKPKTLEISNKDVVLTYSDGVLETKGTQGELYGIERLEHIFLQSAQVNTDIKEIYKDIIEDLKLYRGGSSFDDDTSVLMFRRNTMKDLINTESDEIAKLKAQEGLSRKDVRRLEGKTKSELQKELEDIKKEKETMHIIQILKGLYMTWEFLKLKQEAIRYIKEWYIHKDINFYLKKAVENEESYRMKQKNAKIQNKYNVLLELYKKKDFNTVIQECNEIIAKDWNV